MPPLATQYLRINNLSPTETDRRTLEDGSGTGNNTATTAGFSTNTARRWIQFVPLAANTTSATPVKNGKGWKIDPDTMGSISGQRRVIPAGIWTFRLNLKASTAQLAADTKCRMFVSVVNGTAGTGTVITGLDGIDSAAVTLGLSNVEVAWSSGSIGDVILAPADTIVCEFWVESIGVVAVGQTITLTLENTSIQSRTALPADIKVIYSSTPAGATGIGVAARQTNWVRLAAKTSTGVGVTPVPVKLVRLAAKSATSTGVAPTPLKWARLNPFTATATGISATPAKWVRLAAKSSTAVGVPTRQANWVRLAAKSATSTGVPTATRRIEAARVFAATSIGTSLMTRAVIAVRVFAATAIGVARGDIAMPLTALNRITSGGPVDWSPNDGAKTISGIVKDAAGVAYSGATVQLIRESDGFVAATATSAANGSYSFTRGTTDPYSYRVVAFEDTGTPTQGISARGLVPV